MRRRGSGHSAEPPFGRRTRKKCVRRFIGSDKRLRICSRSALSDSFLRAWREVLLFSRLLFLGLLFFFILRLFEKVENGQILRTAQSAFAPDDVL